MMIAGMKLILLKPSEKQIPVKTHRRKNRRIRKKFLRRYGTRIQFEYFFPPDRIQQVGDTFYAYSPTYYRLIAESKQLEKKYPGNFGRFF